MNARIRTVDFVDDQHGRQLCLQSFHQHVTGLRKRAFAGIHQQHDAVHDFQRALYFSAEIAVPGRVDDVDLRPVITNACRFCQDRDAALALQFIRIHDALGDFFICAENAALAQHGVDERRFSMIDVRNDGDVARVRYFHCSRESATFMVACSRALAAGSQLVTICEPC